ncbi:glycosyl transferase family group 2 domain-containing protein [Hirsutella rhossiliensis]|uniref:Glycosyl transferase family group 2 domain-containing protein n=1 Tax=Hirsutella rhossiliensis TaxID=111463 RepID=A0A9P8N7B8_9HYPO|nr:glycosyl transferase family group 2 domain-containing protein [Hirsutella rhossiliensis]KAH0967301.1 glycosyl transferase family group 2 domain-containing protein [Hirsutella rhossiliensis]
MSLFAWCSRRAGGLSMLALLGLCYWVISQESTLQRHGYKSERPSAPGASYSSTSTSGAGIWTFVFAYYCLLIHVLVFLFPLRACWSVWDITQSLRRSAQSKALENFKMGLRRRGSSTSISSSETLTSDTLTSDSNAYSSTVSEASDVEPELYTDNTDAAQDPVIHAIIIPNYKEEMDTLKETLEVLASHPQAHLSYDIYLGMEQREANGESKALTLIQEFVKKFRSIDYALHPADIPGESAGKGSNLGWAARKLSAKYSMGVRKNVIVTGIDADSHLSPKYFANITLMHLSHPETATTTLYAAPIVFDRNAHGVPAIVRVADILWCAAGISGLYRGSSIAPPTSVYSLPLVLVDRVGGWDCDAEAIGEDLHMYLKCFFALNGNLTCRTVLSPVSQSNVTGGGKGGIRGTIVDMQARYKQALRHMWGALDTGFALRKAVEMWQERKHTSRGFRPLHRSQGDSSNCYFPVNQLSDGSPEQPRESGVFSDVTQDTLKEPHWEHIFYLFHRLFEAHFLPVHMTILVLASALYVWVTDGTDDPNNLGWIFTLCNILRTLGFMEVACYLFLYESFHRICVKTREREMTKAGLADGMCFSHRSIKKNLLDYVLVPLVAPLYGAIPCAQAEISHFWTVDLVYTVSKKVTRQRARSFIVVDDLA